MMKKVLPALFCLLLTPAFLWAAPPAGLYRILDLQSGEVVEHREAPGDLLTNPEYKETRMVFRHIPAGVVVMNDAKTTAVMTQPYWMAVFECTQAQWETIMGGNPSAYQGPHRPVEMGGKRRGLATTVRGGTWPGGEPAQDSFMARLRALSGGKYLFDLPTEAQWEHAARAQATTELNSGKDLSAPLACANLAELGRYDGNLNDGRGAGTTHTDVGSYAPNAWGLYDTHGNVWEQCLDFWWHLPPGEIVDYPGNPGTVSGRVFRGGGWRDSAWFCTSGTRGHGPGDSAAGFRVAIQP